MWLRSHAILFFKRGKGRYHLIVFVYSINIQCLLCARPCSREQNGKKIPAFVKPVLAVGRQTIDK